MYMYAYNTQCQAQADKYVRQIWDDIKNAIVRIQLVSCAVYIM